MHHQTQVEAPPGRSDLFIRRNFDLPVSLLYLAYTDATLLSQWMGTNVLELDNRRHGSWVFETRDKTGRPVFHAHGTIHDVVPDKRIVRTFEMEHAAFGVQLEILSFEATGEHSSRLDIHSLFSSNEVRDKMLKLPFASGIHMAHDRLQLIAGAYRR